MAVGRVGRSTRAALLIDNVTLTDAVQTNVGNISTNVADSLGAYTVTVGLENVAAIETAGNAIAIVVEGAASSPNATVGFVAQAVHDFTTDVVGRVTTQTRS